MSQDLWYLALWAWLMSLTDTRLQGGSFQLSSKWVLTTDVFLEDEWLLPRALCSPRAWVAFSKELCHPTACLPCLSCDSLRKLRGCRVDSWQDSTEPGALTPKLWVSQSKSQLPHLWAVWPRASHLTSLHFPYLENRYILGLNRVRMEYNELSPSSNKKGPSVSLISPNQRQTAFHGLCSHQHAWPALCPLGSSSPLSVWTTASFPFSLCSNVTYHDASLASLH
jgi:hypothetical protein